MFICVCMKRMLTVTLHSDAVCVLLNEAHAYGRLC
jgi:hypothetical protein